MGKMAYLPHRLTIHQGAFIYEPDGLTLLNFHSNRLTLGCL